MMPSYIFSIKWLYFLLLTCQYLLLPSPLFDQSTFKELELINIAQLEVNHSNRFDLSGMVIVNEKVYAVADKGWNNYIYQITHNGKHWEISNTIRLGISEVIDLEGIDFCDNHFFIINEFGNKLYSIDGKGELKTKYIHYNGKGINIHDWGRNAGLEAVAVDCARGIVYVAKERQPRYILEIDIETGIIQSQFNISEQDAYDYADVKCENGFLYILERGGNLVSKIDLSTKEVVEKVSYNATAFESDNRLYEPSKFGMAEALVLTDTEIWIGIDNNGLNASDNAKKKFGLRGNQPAIMKFKRPEGF